MHKPTDTFLFLGVQALGAANDNLVKQAALVLFSFGLIPLVGDSSLWTNAASGLFILPFLLFSSYAGRWSTRQDYRRAMVIIKQLEIVCAIVAGAGILLKQPLLLLLSLFLLGTQSTFFGPVKFSWPARAVAPRQLPKVTGMIEALTFVAILAGSLVGGALVTRPALLVALVLTLAVAGLWMATRLTPMPPRNPTPAPYHDGAETRRCRRLISWFWFLGASYLTQLGLLARELMGLGPQHVSYCLAAFAIGVAIGSPLSARVRHSHRAGWIGLMIMGLWLPVAGASGMSAGLIALAGLGIAGGLYVVPLYVRLQTRLSDDDLPQAIALNNRLNAVYMIASAVAGIGLLSVLGLSARDYFWVLASASLVMAPTVMRFDRPIPDPDQT
ncbi:hypothetical protein GH975_05285 [Litorivicinus lipolyticus]|uniref:MFS transporter n=1 Tax=Litorivicinus lipolyticus TaxID=418701 RepID=A0A5Q2QCH3_9GAMM|nr:hypothetical protein [Litorivicinus lipolyticus]QGG80021.1 hypothetical protein GH975_05285 [Litorivicinus lipolyticus]